MIYRDSFEIYGSNNGVEYSLDAVSGEGISWRNISGRCLESVERDQANILSAGIYRISIDAASLETFRAMIAANGIAWAVVNSPFSFNIENYRSNNKLGYSCSSSVAASLTLDVDRYVCENQRFIVPGLLLSFIAWEEMSGTEIFHVIVGGRWLEAEDRYLEVLMLGELSSSGPASDPVSLTIKNVSGESLTDIQATIVNRASISQDENISNSNFISAILAGFGFIYDLPNDGYMPHDNDIITEMTGPDLPAPIRAEEKNVGNGCWEIFSRGSSIPVPLWPIAGSEAPVWLGSFDIGSPDFVVNRISAISLTATCLNDVFAIQYDFGKGNFRTANVFGIWDIGWITSFAIYGSRDDFDLPASWDLLFEGNTVGDVLLHRGDIYVESVLHCVDYFALKTPNSYRHFRFVPLAIASVTDALELTVAPCLNRIEFLNLPVLGTYVTEDVRPFTKLFRNPGVSPKFKNNATVPITFANVGGSLTDILVDGQGCDVYEVASGIKMAEGKSLSCNGITEYVFSDDSPYAGLGFVLSTGVKESSSAKILVTNGSEVFEVREGSEGAWKKGDQVCEVADILLDQESVSLETRGNPSNKSIDSGLYSTEGLIELTGKTESAQVLFSGNMLNDSVIPDGYSSIRDVLGPFNFTATKLRIRFADSAVPIENAFFGQRASDANFSVGKAMFTFSEGYPYSIEVTNIWTDWLTVDLEPDILYLVSFEGGLGTHRSELYSNVSYRCITGSSFQDNVSYYSKQDTSFLAIAEIELMVEDYHIVSIPLAATVRDQISPFVVMANLFDSDTAAVLAAYGIAPGDIS